ncbi:MAG: 3-methyladenine DNA glycosylase [Marmoricola sp.]
MTVLDRATWQAREAAHQARVDTWIVPHLERRRRHEPHPVHDFLFTYYSHRPSALRRWHPGYGAQLAGRDNAATAGLLADRAALVVRIRRLLEATAGRAPTLGCFGLHEWAMVYGGEDLRHDWPLRLGQDGTDGVVESHRIGCSHFDAFRFFTPSARPLNALQPGRDDREAFEQPGCLHAGMDLYKHAFRLSPLVPSELVADCFALAWDIREVDMRASPYDFSALGITPIAIETPAGKQEYVAQQRRFAERGGVLRARLVEECRRLGGHLATAASTGSP